jgi:hypothetical protein
MVTLNWMVIADLKSMADHHELRASTEGFQKGENEGQRYSCKTSKD